MADDILESELDGIKIHTGVKDFGAPGSKDPKDPKKLKKPQKPRGTKEDETKKPHSHTLEECNRSPVAEGLNRISALLINKSILKNGENVTVEELKKIRWGGWLTYTANYYFPMLPLNHPLVVGVPILITMGILVEGKTKNKKKDVTVTFDPEKDSPGMG